MTGFQAQLVGEAGRGVSNISNMLTITRLHNTLSSVSAMRLDNQNLSLKTVQLNILDDNVIFFQKDS